MNGKRPYRFVLDSDCGTILVSEKVINEAPIPGGPDLDLRILPAPLASAELRGYGVGSRG